jgi:hypothetical protein
MPTTYTPVPSNAPATITLPSDLDDATAESVNVAFRAIADNLMGLAALKSASNTFTRMQSIEIADNPDEPLISTTRTPHNYIANTANPWKRLTGFATGGGAGGRQASLYIGDGTQGLFAIVVNAYWRLTTQLWRQEDASVASHALIITTAGIKYHLQTAGHADWSTWPFTGASMLLDSVFASSLSATGDVTAGGTSWAGASFLYNSPITRTHTPIPILNGSDIQLDTASGDFIPNGAITATERRRFVFRLPHGATMNGIEVVHYQNTSTGNGFFLYQRTSNYASPGAVSPTLIGSVGVGAASTGYKMTTVPTGSHTIDGTKDYVLEWAPQDAGDRIQAARVITWSDLGPANI